MTPIAIPSTPFLSAPDVVPPVVDGLILVLATEAILCNAEVAELR